MKHSFKDRFAYWFDTQMSSGSIALIKLLAVVSALAIAIITVVMVAMGYSEGSGLDVFWDSFATIINAWMPYYSDGDGEIGYLIIMAIAAIIGLLFTSVLIGIISNAIEEYVESLKDGKSKVLEKDHIVILGFTPGDYTLITQVILAAGSKKRTILIGSDINSEELRESITDNVDIPKNVKLIFRTIDICDPASLEKCSLTSCKRIIISPMDDKKTIKTLLAVSLLINSTDNENVRVSALISKNEYEFPDTVAAKHNVTTVQLHNTIAKMVALSCTQTGLSDAFREVFAFDGNEFYSVEMKEATGMTFGELTYKLDKAVPVGLIHEDKVTINPDKDLKIEDGDRLIVFSEEPDSASITEPNYQEVQMNKYHSTDIGRKVAMIGFNSSIRTIFNEMPKDISEIIIAGVPSEKKDLISRLNASAKRTISFFDEDIDEEENMIELVKKADHVVLLSDYAMEDEDADIQSIFRIMRLRDIRTKNNMPFNITTEMRKKSNLNLIRIDDHLDYVVASNMSSLFLAQLSENYDIRDLFKEILSNEGNELHLRKVRDFGCEGTYSTLQLRNLGLENNCIILGYLRADTYESFFNPGLGEQIDLKPEDSLIVLAEN